MIVAVLGVVGGCLAGCSPPQGPSPLDPGHAVAGESVGPQASVTCPPGAIDVPVGTSIQAVVNAHPGDTVFCIRAGVHQVTSAITPRTGNTFVGEYGAVLDGAGWRTGDDTQAAFRAHNEDIDDVSIRNLVIRNMPQKGIHAFSFASDRWLIEHNDISGNQTGVSAPRAATIRFNHIHDNAAGGYSAYEGHGTVFAHNEIARNGREQKIVGAVGVVFRNNFVHHNAADGIWYDTDNSAALVEGNRVEDNGRAGISYEASAGGVIRSNTVRRSGDAGIFVSNSKQVETEGNTLEDNFRGVHYFLDCAVVGGGAIGWDLADNLTRGNTVHVGARAGSLANLFSHASRCTADELGPYLNGSKNLRFQQNDYVVPSLAARWWAWGTGQLRSWSEWQALGHDLTGTVSGR
jgi:parallel beta-helix repeat protein